MKSPCSDIGHPYDNGEYLAKEIEKQMRLALGNALYDWLESQGEIVTKPNSSGNGIDSYPLLLD